MTAVLQINTAPISQRRATSLHPAHDSELSIAATRRVQESRPVRVRSLVAALVLGVVIGSMAWMHGEAAGSSDGEVEDPKIEVMAVEVMAELNAGTN